MRKEKENDAAFQAVRIGLFAVIDIVLLYLYFYSSCTALTLSSHGMQSVLVGVPVICLLETAFLHYVAGDGYERLAKRCMLVFGAAALAMVLLVAVGDLVQSPLMRARSYASLLPVTDSDADSTIPTADGTDAIALMDTASAAKLGDREIGSLSDVVSQYDVGAYTQINYQGRPVKAAPLEYSGFWKWSQNRKSGTPGYVLVDPVTMQASYVKADKGMRYTPSAWFGDNLTRHIHEKYPSMLFGNTHFELDEDGTPYFVSTVFRRKGTFGALTVKGCLVTDPCTGDITCYSAGSVPEWVDVVYPGDLLCWQYNYSAQLAGGFWNSQFGQKGCRKTTELENGADYGYIAKNGDIWIYTGVTSVNSDSSNLGFLVANERTGEARYVSCAGADEASAMNSAEGEVQQYGYTASFPSLIRVGNVPTYIMVLKDRSGLVKMYACVNVSQYNQVAAASTQAECLSRYKKLIAGEISSGDAVSASDASSESDTSSVESGTDSAAWETKTITVQAAEPIDKNGNTYLYVLDTDGNIYYAKYTDVLGMMGVGSGSTVTIETDGSRFRLPEG